METKAPAFQFYADTPFVYQGRALTDSAMQRMYAEMSVPKNLPWFIDKEAAVRRIEASQPLRFRSIKRTPWLDSRVSDMSANCRRVAGVYVLYLRGKIQYVGQSQSAQSRCLMHRDRRLFDYDTVKIRRVDDKIERLWLERKLIHRLRPRWNSSIPVVLKDQYHPQFEGLR